MVTRTRPTAEPAEPANGRSRAGGGAPAGRPAADPWAALQRAWAALGKRLPEMRQDASCYAAVQADRVRLAGSRLASHLVWVLVQMVAVAAVIAIGASLLIAGIAGGVAAALHGNLWLANIITGLGALLGLGSTIALVLGSRRRRRLRHLQRRYQAHEARDRAMQDDAQEARQHAAGT